MNGYIKRRDTTGKDEKFVKAFREKLFEERPSLLTMLFKETDLSALRNFFIAIFLLLFVKTIVEDSINHGNPFHHTWLIFWNFKRLPLTLAFWSIMMASSLILYGWLFIWSRIPSKKVDHQGLHVTIILYVTYIFTFFYTCVKFIFWAELNSASTFIVTCESTRITMKVHSFLRETYPIILRLKAAAAKKDDLSDEDCEQLPSPKQYFYFLFCPTFIFRKEYPRSSSCDWNAVKIYMIQIFLIVYCVDLVFVQMIHPIFSTINYVTVGWTTVISLIFVSVVPGTLCLLLLFYGLLHCWLNMFSEILRFADRQFYLNWWSSKSMAEYYRYWNLVVHEWLYTYVYKDISQFIGGRMGRVIAQSIVFFLSSAVHEYWFGLALRMFYPVIFILYFIFGGIFFIISQSIKSSQVWNVAMFTNLLIGLGMFVALYAQEWYARQQCAPYFQSKLFDSILPRHWFCKTVYHD